VSEVISLASVLPRKEFQTKKLASIESVNEFLAQKAQLRIVNSDQLKAAVDQLSEKISDYEQARLAADMQILNESDFTKSKETLKYVSALLDEQADNTNLENLSTIVYDSMNDIGSIMMGVTYLETKDLPKAYKSQFISKDGNKFMISVYPDFDI